MEGDRTPPRVFFTAKRKTIVMVILGGLIALLCMVIAVSYKTVHHFYAKAPSPLAVYTVDKTINAKIPSSVPVEVTIEKNIPASLSKVLHVQLPLRKDIDVLIDDDFAVPVDQVLSVPVDQDVYVEAEVPVTLEVPMEGKTVETSILGIKKVFPLHGTIPIDTVIHLKQPVRITTRIDVRLNDIINVHVHKRLSLPLDLNLEVKIPIDGIFDVRLAKDVMVYARLPESIPVDVHLEIVVPKIGVQPEAVYPMDGKEAQATGVPAREEP